MTVQFDELDLVNQMRVKQLFDPKWHLNPNKVFPENVAKKFKEQGALTSYGAEP